MIDIIKELIIDFQESQLQVGINRHLHITPISGKATVCIGVRRSGKSTYFFQLIKQLLDSGVSIENICYLNFFDDRLHELKHTGLGVITEAYYSLFPQKKNVEKIYWFFDEIQMIENWEPFVSRLMRSEKSEVYITGSSAQMLSTEIATQMRGRALAWEMFPFSFQEYLDYKKIKSTDLLSTKKRLLIQSFFEDYWKSGGFPEVLDLDKPVRVKVHQEYFNTLLFRDLVERHDISHPKAVIDLAYYLIDNIASLHSVNRLNGYLKSLGHKISKSSIIDYLKWFEDAYFLFSVRLFDASLTRSQSNPKKVYCIDHSLVTSISSGILLNTGHLLENLVFATLRRTHSNIYYYRTRNAHEVDFVLPEKTRGLVQVCESLRDEKTRKREIVALNEAMGELGVKAAIIVTRAHEEKIEVENGQIEVIPIWRFLLKAK